MSGGVGSVNGGKTGGPGNGFGCGSPGLGDGLSGKVGEGGVDGWSGIFLGTSDPLTKQICHFIREKCKTGANRHESRGFC